MSSAERLREMAEVLRPRGFPTRRGYATLAAVWAAGWVLTAALWQLSPWLGWLLTAALAAVALGVVSVTFVRTLRTGRPWM